MLQQLHKILFTDVLSVKIDLRNRTHTVNTEASSIQKMNRNQGLQCFIIVQHNLV